MSNHKKIDIIIPAYKAHDTLPRTLASIASQTIVDQCTVYVCNDADGIGYRDIVAQFEGLMDIRELTLPVNGGCGVARQYGIDHSHAPFWICQDADDTFASAFSLYILLKYMEANDKNVMISGAFAEEIVTDKGEMQFVMHQNDTVWMHGKIYRRAFMDKYGIRFNSTRSNEDNGLNTCVRLIANENEKIVFIPDVVHYWHFKADSITRVNNHEYTYNQSFIGYADNMTWAIEKLRTVSPMNKAADVLAINTMAELYIYYMQTVYRDPRFRLQNFNRCVKYFDEIYFAFADKLPKQIQESYIAQIFKMRAPAMDGIIPHVTIWQFIEQLKGGYITDVQVTDKAIAIAANV